MCPGAYHRIRRWRMPVLVTLSCHVRSRLFLWVIVTSVGALLVTLTVLCLPEWVPESVFPPSFVLAGGLAPRLTIPSLSEISSRTSTTTSPSPSPPTPRTSMTWKASSPGASSSNASLTQAFLPCKWQVHHVPQRLRTQALPDCHEKRPRTTYKEVLSNSTPVTTLSPAETSCLKRVIQDHCYDVKARVPRLAHYVWFGKEEKEEEKMPWHFFVGVLSVARFLQPCWILFHGDSPPAGVYWQALLQLLPNVLHLPRPRPREIFGNVINVMEHSADVTRLQVLLEYGGVYIDTDQYLLRPVSELLTYAVTIGTERPGENCGNGLIFSEPEAPFLRLWLSSYTTFNDGVWADHSTVVPYNLSRQHPRLVHLVDSFFRPNYKHIEPLYAGGGRYAWAGLHALHLYHRFFSRYFHTGTRMDRQSSVIGDMTRHVIYGSWERCYEPQNNGVKL